MANKINVNRYRALISFPLETMAKVRTYLKGRKVKAESVGGRKVRVPYRAMTVSDLVVGEVESVVAGVRMDAESAKWLKMQHGRNVKSREVMDERVRNGYGKKPRSEWKKIGRPRKVSDCGLMKNSAV